MDLLDLKAAIEYELMDLRFELTSWEDSIPVDVVKKWIKGVERQLMRGML